MLRKRSITYIIEIKFFFKKKDTHDGKIYKMQRKSEIVISKKQLKTFNSVITEHISDLEVIRNFILMKFI